MTKAEKKKLERAKQNYRLHRNQAMEIFKKSPEEFDRLDECTKRLAERHYGEAEGIYAVLCILGLADDLPEIDF